MNHNKIFELISIRQTLLGKLKKIDNEIIEKLNKYNNGDVLVDENYPLGYEEDDDCEEDDIFFDDEEEESGFGFGGDWWKNN